MAADPLDDVLRLVAEGRLTPDEAAPILAALDAAQGPATVPSSADAASAAPDDTQPGRATSIRLEIRDGDHQVVNLRLPIAVGRLALDRIPGLSVDQVERVKEALGSGLRGRILDVDDGDSTVRIVVE